MEDVNESSSESGIRVDGIIDYASFYKFNKKAYDIKLTKKSDNTYISRLGFNMYKLPQGEYTICVEVFLGSNFSPITFLDSVSAVSSSLNVGLQRTTGHRTIIHIHKYKISPPEYLMIDMHCTGTSSSPSLGQVYLIIYGVIGYHSDVSPTIYDQPYVLENGSIIMQANLNMNNHTIINWPSQKHLFIINGNYNKSLHNTYILFSGEQDFVLPVNCKIKNCSLHIHDSLSSYPSINLTICINVTSVGKTINGSSSKIQQCNNIDLNLLKGEIIGIHAIINSGSLQSTTPQ